MAEPSTSYEPQCSAQSALYQVVRDHFETLLIEEATVIGRILRHLGLPAAIPAPRPARAPPLLAGVPDAAGWDDDTSEFAP